MLNLRKIFVFFAAIGSVALWGQSAPTAKASASSAAPATAASTASASSTPADPELVSRIQEHIRARFKIPADVAIEVSAFTPSNIPGYNAVTITLARGSRSSTHHFYISNDGKTLAQFSTIDISQKVFTVADRPSRGAADAKVTLIVYDDFECPYCARNYKALFSDLLPEYKDKVRVVYKDFPLYQIHPWAIHAAVDANCLFSQSNDAYWDFADYVHNNQGAINGSGHNLQDQFKALDDSALSSGQKEHLDAAKLQACIQAQDDSAVMASEKFGSDSLDIDATPTMFLNGERMDGAVPEDVLRASLNKALLNAGEIPPVAAVVPSTPAQNGGAAQNKAGAQDGAAPKPNATAPGATNQAKSPTASAPAKNN